MDAVLNSISQAKTTQDLRGLLIDYFARFGVTNLNYRHFKSIHREDEATGPDGLQGSGFSEAAPRGFAAQNTSQADPIPELARMTLRPFLWSDVPRLMRLNDAQKAFLRDVLAAGLGEGVAFQVFGPGVRNGYMSLGLPATRPRWSDGQLRVLQTVGQAAHLRHCEITLLDQPRRNLSPRERQILQWIARGKSNSEIAIILELSRHTVDTIVRRIFDKLGVADRMAATLRGIGAGVILPFD